MMFRYVRSRLSISYRSSLTNRLPRRCRSRWGRLYRYVSPLILSHPSTSTLRQLSIIQSFNFIFNFSGYLTSIDASRLSSSYLVLPSRNAQEYQSVRVRRPRRRARIIEFLHTKHLLPAFCPSLILSLII